MIFTGKIYDVLKWIAQVVLPAVGTLYFTIDQLADWHHGTLVSGIVLAVDTFLGVILGISSSQYNKQQADSQPTGNLIVSEVDGEKYFSLGLTSADFKSLGNDPTVTLNVVRNTGNKPPTA